MSFFVGGGERPRFDFKDLSEVFPSGSSCLETRRVLSTGRFAAFECVRPRFACCSLYFLWRWRVALTRLPRRTRLTFSRAKFVRFFAEHCYSCHSEKAEKLKGRACVLDSSEAVLKGGTTGPAIVRGEPDNSLLIKAVRYNRSRPADAAEEQEAFERANRKPWKAWVKMGAPMPAAAGTKALSNVDTVRAKHWAFQPVKKPGFTAGREQAMDPKRPWIIFVLAKLEQQKNQAGGCGRPAHFDSGA